jgi:ferredoxin
MLRCPSLINLDEWGFATVSGASITDDGILQRARLAVAACPEHALRLVADLAPPVRRGAAGSGTD